MSETSTAEIIAFPMSRMEQVGRDRLVRSLDRLQAAAAGQVAAVAAWRDQLGRLSEGVGALGQSFETYNTRLASTGRSVEALNGEARRLEAWAACAIPAPPR